MKLKLPSLTHSERVPETIFSSLAALFGMIAIGFTFIAFMILLK